MNVNGYLAEKLLSVLTYGELPTTMFLRNSKTQSLCGKKNKALVLLFVF
nr:MAG TPA: hypothetical protein [Caudoviricetes sp.]